MASTSIYVFVENSYRLQLVLKAYNKECIYVLYALNKDNCKDKERGLGLILQYDQDYHEYECNRSFGMQVMCKWSRCPIYTAITNIRYMYSTLCSIWTIFIKENLSQTKIWPLIANELEICQNGPWM